MTIIQAIVLAAVQGLTEFLPVSSSAHLVLIPKLLGWNALINSPAQFSFDIALHFGSLIALIVYFSDDIAAIFKSLKPGKDKRLLLFLAVGSIPTFIAGITLENLFKKMFSQPFDVAVQLLITAALLFAVERIRTNHHKNINDMSSMQAFIIGIGQAISIIPGISRSGATIAFGVFQGLKREEAARFSFLLSIPAIAGATVFTLVQGDFVLTTAWAFGLVTSVLISYLAIKYFLAYLRRGSLLVFAYYCLFAGLFFIIMIKLNII